MDNDRSIRIRRSDLKFLNEQGVIDSAALALLASRQKLAQFRGLMTKENLTPFYRSQLLYDLQRGDYESRRHIRNLVGTFRISKRAERMTSRAIGGNNVLVPLGKGAMTVKLSDRKILARFAPHRQAAAYLITIPATGGKLYQRDRKYPPILLKRIFISLLKYGTLPANTPMPLLATESGDVALTRQSLATVNRGIAEGLPPTVAFLVGGESKKSA